MFDVSRLRLTALLTTPAALVVLLVVSGSFWYLLTAPDSGVDGALARAGEALALIIVTDGASFASETQVVVFGIVLPLLGLAGAAGVAWWIAGQVVRRLDTAAQTVAQADADREANLQEVIHELRTPLAIMTTNLELASKGTSETTRYLSAADKAVERMARTVDDLSSHGGLAIEEASTLVDVGDIAAATASTYVATGRESDVDVLIGGHGGVMVDAVDPDAVGTVLSNLVSNAVRLSPPGSAVSIDWGNADNWTWVSVTDDGPGLEHVEHALVFERGWQGAHDRDRTTRGSAGLGLTIARQLAEAQGGAVTVASRVGAGATFTMWLPQSLDANRDEVVASDGVHPVIRPWEPAPATA